MAFSLELCAESAADLKFVEKEAAKLVAKVKSLAPDLNLQVICRVAEDIYRVPLTDSNGRQFTVPNENPKNWSHQCLLITREEFGCHGLAGAHKGCVNKSALANAGDDSADIVLHEWLHTISHITGINPDWAEANGYRLVKSANNRGSWQASDGTDWNARILKVL